MEWNGYEISNYTSADVDEIARFLSYLWVGDEETNKKLFMWRELRNPFAKKPASVIAKRDGKIVGFNGCLPAQWGIKGEKFMILNCGDALVHPDHRGKGLYAGMFKYVMKEYCHDYQFMVGFTPNQLSTPAAMKFGWKPLFIRKYLRHINLLQLTKSKIHISDTDVLEPGKFGDIEVSYTVRSADISRIDSNSTYKLTKLGVNKTPSFIEWKLSENHIKYAYFYHLRESKVNAYLILSLNGSNAHVIDYGEEVGSDGIKKIFNFIVDSTKLASISFLTASMPENLKAFLKTKHFYDFDHVEKKVKRQSYNLPIIIRPVIDDYKEDDWFIGNVDIREIDNWHITEICFD